MYGNTTLVKLSLLPALGNLPNCHAELVFLHVFWNPNKACTLPVPLAFQDSFHYTGLFLFLVLKNQEPLSTLAAGISFS